MFALTAHAPCPSRFGQRRRLLVHPLVGRIVMKSRMPVLLADRNDFVTTNLGRNLPNQSSLSI